MSSGSRSGPAALPAIDRGRALARLFDRAQVGAYVGLLRESGDETVAANARLRLILGYEPETGDGAVAPLAAERFVDPQARDHLLGLLQRDGAVADFLVRLRRVDITPIWVEITAQAEAADGGLRVEALIRDVSDRKKLDDQTRDLYHQLLQAEKMASLGQTISGIAHELNNPLATILTWAERLSHRQVDDATRRDSSIAWMMMRGSTPRSLLSCMIVFQTLTFIPSSQFPVQGAQG